MEIQLLDNPQEIRQNFINRFVMSWEEFQDKQRDWIAETAQSNYPIDIQWYEQAYMWDRMDTEFPCVSIKEALAFLQAQEGDVLFMSEGETHRYPGELFFDNRKIKYFVAQANAAELAALVEEEWFESYILAEQNMYNPNPVLPSDLYVFDPSLKWCVVLPMKQRTGSRKSTSP